MKDCNGVNYLKKALWSRMLVMLLCILAVVGGIAAIVVAENDPLKEETREETKARLLWMCQYAGWDPYSSDMTLDEFYALMELFDEGKLPLKSTARRVSANTNTMSDTKDFIPRTRFLFAGLPNMTGDNAPQFYDNGGDGQEPYYNEKGEQKFYYPSGLDPFHQGYQRPPEKWKGVPVADKQNSRVTLVMENENEDLAIVGNVNQDLFIKYDGYYVRRVTIDGTEIAILGVIQVPNTNRMVYYYLSTEGQDTQVSTTTLSDDEKFIVEYVPNEHKVDYEVKMEDDSEVPDGIDVDKIFGTYRPWRTTDGAYSFDVLVPYGYEIRILIAIKIYPSVPYGSKAVLDNKFFDIEIDHTSKFDTVKGKWLSSYCDYLIKEGLVEDEADFERHIEATIDQETGKYTFTWKVLAGTSERDEKDKAAHDDILARMAERINNFNEHNNGYPLGRYPTYNSYPGHGFSIYPNADVGPTAITMQETFYNNFVKADRTVTAVLTKLGKPTFSVEQVLRNSTGASDRGTSAPGKWAMGDFDADYEFHKEHGDGKDMTGDPMGGHDGVYGNIRSDDGWRWTSRDGEYFGPSKDSMTAIEMRSNDNGTYDYIWVFQTNNGSGGYTLDAFEVNGVGVPCPYVPKYAWSNYTGVVSDKLPYATEAKLADGATVRIEMMIGFGIQRVYRISILGAQQNVTVTGINLMQGTGAPEISPHSLSGVYSDMDGYGQTDLGVDFFRKNGLWKRFGQANVAVDDGSDSMDYGDANTDFYGANVRFKVANGYGNPYYIFTDRYGNLIGSQTSVVYNDDGTVKSYNPIIPLKDVNKLKAGEPGALKDGKTLDPSYIYYDSSTGYYYIRIEEKMSSIGLFTLAARTVKYTTRYAESYDPKFDDQTSKEEPWYGFVMDPEKGLVKLTKSWMQEHEWPFNLKEGSMPTFEHNSESCPLWQMAIDKDYGDVPPEYKRILHQYDDNGGGFYDMIYNNMASIPADKYGIIRPVDANGNYSFVSWIIVGEDYQPVKDKAGNVIQFLNGAIDLREYAEYAVTHAVFGSDDTDINVLRLMPVWKPISNPYRYNIIINYVDALGVVRQEVFDSADITWNSVVTETPEGGVLYVYVNKNAGPLRDWIANHPTYVYWDDVNNAIDNPDGTEAKAKIGKTLEEYLKREYEGKDLPDNYQKTYQDILDALLKLNYTGDKDVKDFARLGGDVFQVNEDGGSIALWFYEDKGGLIIHKDAKNQFIYNDEFYFTIMGNATLNGEYKAYPEHVYDEDGKPRNYLDSDAWIITFKNGQVVKIEKDGKPCGTVITDAQGKPVLDEKGNKTYYYHFTLRHDEGIKIFVPDGEYSVIELGSKSGENYKTKVDYTGKTAQGTNWTLPSGWLKGDSKVYYPGNNNEKISQVVATITFKNGAHNVVETITFHNQATALSIENELIRVNDKQFDQYKDSFYFEIRLYLPSCYVPIYDVENKEYYFLFHYIIYREENGNTFGETQNEVKFTQITDEDNRTYYVARIQVIALERAEFIIPIVDDSATIIFDIIQEDVNGFVPQWKVDHGADEGAGSAGEGGDAGAGTQSARAIADEEQPNVDLRDGYTFDNPESGELNPAEKTYIYVLNTYIMPDYGYLVITEEGADPNETFLYLIEDSLGKQMIVSVQGGGKTYVFLPTGEYTVRELSDWSWRYGEGMATTSRDGAGVGPRKGVIIAFINADNVTRATAFSIDYKHTPNNKPWLGGENSQDSLFN